MTSTSQKTKPKKTEFSAQITEIGSELSNITGKNNQELEKVIQKLEQEIGKIKEKLENNNPDNSGPPPENPVSVNNQFTYRNFIELLKSQDKKFFVSKNTLDKPFEFVVIKSQSLADINQDYSSFQKHFDKSSNINVVSFPSPSEVANKLIEELEKGADAPRWLNTEGTGEKFYAVGRIPNVFGKREGKPSYDAITAARLIDRSLRSFFPFPSQQEVQITNSVLSFDPDCDPRVVKLIVSATEEKITMLEAGAREIDEAELTQAITFAHQEIQKKKPTTNEKEKKMKEVRQKLTQEYYVQNPQLEEEFVKDLVEEF
ncbi:12885_t:CDS:2 [Racocetra persica]|uniref:12885_t:CDS:1 n=1 Tax=Racocetra persica TaxID=160502 RepID=A0ACA9NTT4_9GLOM|nr:12885_t:CDS:2 [Racocetra persica]